jgi:cation diffusion facilitator CzcD-associated flavoprotein CzcO
MRDVDVVVVGAGQAGLSAGYFLSQRGFVPHEGFVILDRDDRPGGAWQHRSPTLTMATVHGVHDLPGLHLDEPDPAAPAREVVPAYFAAYERRYALPVVRPTVVGRVDDDGGPLLVSSDHGRWRTRGLVNATGTWTRPFVPSYAGAGRFGGRQLHSADYRGPEPFAGQHVIVVGGGHSAIQHLAELAPVATVTWVTRRPPRWRDDGFDETARRAAVAEVAREVEAGRRPGSVVGVTGLVETATVQRARDLGALHRLPMFERLTEDGAVWADGREVHADAILWATGFRHALDHLAPLGLRSRAGGIRMAGTQVADDPRIHLLGYGPSASTIGANRAARTAVRDLRRYLDAGRGRAAA